MTMTLSTHLVLPSQSSDLNSNENVFSWLKQKLSRKRFRTLDELKTELLEMRESKTQEFLQPYYKSMKRQCELVLKNDGNSINY